MNTRLDKQEMSRRTFARLSCMVLGMLSANVTPVSAQAKKRKPQTERTKQGRQTSPITIGGGSSVSINFDRCWFKDDNPLKPKQYWNPSDEIEKLWIINDIGARLPFPQATAGKTITVDCARADGNVSKIVVTCKPLGVEFEPTDFPYDPVQDVCFSAERKITKVWISDISDPVFEAKEGKCWVLVDDPAR